MPPTKRSRQDEGSTSPKRIKTAAKAGPQTLSVDVPEVKTSPEGDTYWDVSSNSCALHRKLGQVLTDLKLSIKRRVTVQEFKGTPLIAIREFYEKDGKQLPGKQGISLTVEQFAILLKAGEGIKKALKEKGVDIQDMQPGGTDDERDD